MNSTTRTSRTGSSLRLLSLAAGVSLFLALPLSLHAAPTRNQRTGADGLPSVKLTQVEKSKSVTKKDEVQVCTISSDIRRMYDRYNRILRSVLGLHG